MKVLSVPSFLALKLHSLPWPVDGLCARMSSSVLGWNSDRHSLSPRDEGVGLLSYFSLTFLFIYFFSLRGLGQLRSLLLNINESVRRSFLGGPMAYERSSVKRELCPSWLTVVLSPDPGSLKSQAYMHACPRPWQDEGMEKRGLQHDQSPLWVFLCSLLCGICTHLLACK